MHRHKSSIAKSDNEVKTSKVQASPTQPSCHNWFGRLIEKLSEQKIRAWQPVVTPTVVVVLSMALGLVFIGLGAFLLRTSLNVIECQVRYNEDACNSSGCTVDTLVTLDANSCQGVNTDDGESPTIDPPVFVYYRLSNFYQNHRRYVYSRNDEQLSGQVFTSREELESCHPVVVDSKNETKVLSPCGLIAWTVFNDTFSFTKGNDQPIGLDDSVDTIVWSGDHSKFKNPKISEEDAKLVTEWLDPEIFPNKVENPHFILWMKVASLPDFRKLYGRINVALKLPIKIHIKNRYPVNAYGGKKWIVLSQVSWLGGRNHFLGSAYITVGALSLIFAMFFATRNYYNPRRLGDIGHLNMIFDRKRRLPSSGNT